MSSLPGETCHETVFVLGNNRAARKSLLRVLCSLGFDPIPFTSAESFAQNVDFSTPGCLLLDFLLTAPSNIDFQHWTPPDYDRPFVVLSSLCDTRLAVQAIKAGAVDFLTRPVKSEELLQAVRSALAKDRHLRFARMQLNSLIAEFKSFKHRLSRLTPREREVLRYLLVGERNKEIAFQLGITEKTIKVHRARVMEKMEVQSVAALVRAASQRGIGLGLEPRTESWPSSSRAASA